MQGEINPQNYPKRVNGKAATHRQSPFTRLPWYKIRPLLVLYPGDVILDVLCTDKSLLIHLMHERRDIYLSGACFTPEDARRARKKLPCADIMFVNGEFLPWNDGSVDVALITHENWIMPHIAVTLRNTFSVLRPGGQLIFTCTCYPLLLRYIYNRFVQMFGNKYTAEKILSRREWVRLLSIAGFTSIRWKRVGLFKHAAIGWKRQIYR